MDFKDKYEKLEKYSNNINILLGHICHDLKSPMMVIRGYIDLLSREVSGKLNNKQQTQLNIIKRTLARQDFILDKFMEISRYERDKEINENIEMYLSNLIQHSIYINTANINKNKLKIDIQDDIEEIIVLTCPEKVNIILSDLLEKLILISEKEEELKIYIKSMNDNRVIIGMSVNGKDFDLRNENIFHEDFNMDLKIPIFREVFGFEMSILKKIGEIADINIDFKNIKNRYSFYLSLQIAN